jgi:hypothetical protein
LGADVEEEIVVEKYIEEEKDIFSFLVARDTKRCALRELLTYGASIY